VSVSTLSIISRNN